MNFFFQAEDGIRDRNVTGVQTCALPIWDPSPVRPWSRAPRAGEGGSSRSRRACTVSDPRPAEAVCPAHRAGRCPERPAGGASGWRRMRSRQRSWAHDVTAESPGLLRRRPTAVAAGALLMLVPFGLLSALLR